MEDVEMMRILLSYIVLVAYVCRGLPVMPLLISSKHWQVFEDDPVGSTVTRLRALTAEGGRVTFALESQRPEQDLHTYFVLDKHWRVLVAKPLHGLAGDDTSRDYILRVRMNDGISSPIAEVRLEVLKLPEGDDEERKGEGVQSSRVSGARRLGGRRIKDAQRSQDIKSDLPIGYYGILSESGSSNTFGFIPSILRSHPPLVLVNRTWSVRADAPVGTVVDTVEVIQIRGSEYNLTLSGTDGMLAIDRYSGRVTVAKTLPNQSSDLTVMVTVSNEYGDSSEPVVFRILPLASKAPIPSTTNTVTTTTTTGTTAKSPIERDWKEVVPDSVPDPVPDPVEVEGRIIVYGKNEEPLAKLSKQSKSNFASESSRSLEAYTIICLVLMPILVVICVSSLAVVGFCYHQRRHMRKTLAVLESRSSTYIPK